MNFYKHFIGDYGRDTGHLTLVEHGAYRLMLDHFYGTSRPLPKEKRPLYRLLRAENETERRAVVAVSLQFWRQVPGDLSTLYGWLGLNTDEERRPLGTVAAEWTEAGGLINVRALAEIINATVIAEKNRQIAISREQKKRAQASSGGQF